MNLNPILKRELRVLLRPKRALMLSMVYVTALAVAFLAAYMYLPEILDLCGKSYKRLRAGHDLFAVMILGQAALVCALAPALTANSFAVERERRTMSLLMTAPIDSGRIVRGKLVASLAHVSLLVLASLPMVGMCVLIGGVDPLGALAAYFMLLVVGWTLGMIGLWASARCLGSAAATSGAYIVLFCILGGGPGLDLAGGIARFIVMVAFGLWVVKVAVVHVSAARGVGGMGTLMLAIGAALTVVILSTGSFGATRLLCWLNPLVSLWYLLTTEDPGVMCAAFAATTCAYCLLCAVLHADAARALVRETLFEARLGPDDLLETVPRPRANGASDDSAGQK